MIFEYLRGLGRGRPVRVALLAGLVVALVGSSLALADEHEEGPAPVEDRPEDGAIVFSLPDELGDFVDCSEANIVPDGDGDALSTDVEGCLAAPALGPNGQWNHGQAVRAFVHALKALEFDGPPGHLVRNAAKSKIGKNHDDGDSLDLTATSESDHPGKAKGRR